MVYFRTRSKVNITINSVEVPKFNNSRIFLWKWESCLPLSERTGRWRERLTSERRKSRWSLDIAIDAWGGSLAFCWFFSDGASLFLCIIGVSLWLFFFFEVVGSVFLPFWFLSRPIVWWHALSRADKLETILSLLKKMFYLFILET